MSEKKQDPGLDGREVGLLVLLCGGGFWYKYGAAIQLWFHDNMVEVVLGGAALLTLLGYLIVRKFQKKNEEEIRRIKRVQAAKTQTQSVNQYYARRNQKDQSL